MEESVVVTINGTLVVLVSVWMWHRSTSARRRITAWFEARGYVVRDTEFRLLRSGPYLLEPIWGGVAMVYRVSVRDDVGTSYRAWVLVGHPLVGLFSKRVQVTWDRRAN